MTPARKNPIYVQLYIFTTVILLLAAAVNFLQPTILYHKIWWLIVFFFLLTLLSFRAVTTFTDKDPGSFIAIYFTAMIARLFISILVASAFILLDKQHVMTFAYNFIVLYLLFLGFEIYGIMTTLRHQNKTGADND